LSNAHLENFNEGNPLKMHEFEKSDRHNHKSKQIKKRWSEAEQVKFLEALELYGPKSKRLLI
jgi:hypothetical protein